MLFNTVSFLLFLAVVLVLVAVARRWGWRAENCVLILASCFFYGSWDVRFLGLLFFTSAVDYLAARQIQRSTSPARRRIFLTCSLATNLGVLGFFKYFNFFIYNLSHLLPASHLPDHLLDVILPVGISFYTFQAMSYTIDVYRGRTAACENVRDFLAYITFFPQLVAGPIERAQELLPQLRRTRVVTAVDIAEGFYLVLWGYAKKTVVADNLGLKVDRIFAQATYSTTDVLVATFGFAFQIYADFSGYTDIARGVARWLGIRLCLNFDHPYFSTNPREFWQRWHISLSTWLREYLYIPLGGNRLGEARTYGNLFLTMLLGGLWHGAAWNFVLWGGYQGALLVGHRVVETRFSPGGTPRKKVRPTSQPLWPLKVAAMFCAILYGWLLFRARTAAQLLGAHRALWHWHLSADLPSRVLKLLPYVGLIVLVDCFTFFSGDAFFLARRSPWVTAAFYTFLLCAVIILGVTGGEQFIYFAF